MGVAGREIRIVDGAYTGDPDAPVGPPVLDAWVRFTGARRPADCMPGCWPSSPGTSRSPPPFGRTPASGQDQAHRTLSTAVNAISLSFHADVRVDRWLLYRHLSTAAADGMAHSECRVHDEAGALVASFTTDCMVRAFAGGAMADERTSL